jgi:2-oxoglutarate ferredoxin oxidoreductase subunit alpha
MSVSSLHLPFLSPLPPGLEEIFGHFERVLTVEINYSDDPDDPFISRENRRYSQLTWLLRARTLVDLDCWSRVPGQPLRPGEIMTAVRQRSRTEVMV